MYDNGYGRPGAISAREVYNEDYNYAYQSFDDNLPYQSEEIGGVSVDSTTYQTATSGFQPVNTYHTVPVTSTYQHNGTVAPDTRQTSAEDYYYK